MRALASVSKLLAHLKDRWGLVKWPTVNPKNIRDKIYVILKERGKHMHFNEIAAAINEKSDEHGVVATVSGATTAGKLVLNSVDGSEIKINLDGTNATLATTGLLETANSTAQSISIADVDISTQDGAQEAIEVVDRALDTVNDIRSNLGAASNRLDFTINNLMVVSENTAAARSRILDADFAAETAALSRAQVLQQASQAMLAQANAQPQQVLQLLQG